MFGDSVCRSGSPKVRRFGRHQASFKFKKNTKDIFCTVVLLYDYCVQNC
jgi:hypothetical protein